jgi:hypothetical protein
VTLLDSAATNVITLVLETGERERAFLDARGTGATPLDLRRAADMIEIRIPLAKLPGDLGYWYAGSTRR